MTSVQCQLIPIVSSPVPYGISSPSAFSYFEPSYASASVDHDCMPAVTFVSVVYKPSAYFETFASLITKLVSGMPEYPSTLSVALVSPATPCESGSINFP